MTPTSVGWTEVVSAISAAISCAVLIIAAGVAWNQLREAQRLRKAQTRPFVVLDFDVSDRGSVIHLKVTNIGGTLARDIHFRFEPALSSSLDTKGAQIPLQELRMFVQGVPSLPPGKVIDLIFDSLQNRGDRPDVYTATVDYKDEQGDKYSDRYVLDLAIYKNFWSETRDGLHEIHQRLQEIKRVIEHWSAGYEGGLLVLSPEERRRRQEQQLAADPLDEPPLPK